MTIILKIQSANSSKLRIDILFHLLNALDWSPVVPYALPLMVFYQSMARCARLVLLDSLHRSTRYMHGTDASYWPASVYGYLSSG